eukprot:s4657_g9.t1
MSQSDAERRGAEQRGSAEERRGSSKAVGGGSRTAAAERRGRSREPKLSGDGGAVRQQAVTAAAGAAQQIGAAVQPCSRAARQLRRSRRRGETVARQETAVLLDANNQASLGPNQTISAGSANFFIEANKAGAATGSFYGFQNLSACAPSGGQRTRAVFWQVCTYSGESSW